MLNETPGSTETLIDLLNEESNGFGLVNSLGLASALMLLQEQSALGAQTLSPSALALKALSLDILALEPGLTSLSAGVGPQVLASMQNKAGLLNWSGLLEQAQALAGELAESVEANDGNALEALGLESLDLLQGDLYDLGETLPEVMDVSVLNTPPSVVASLNDGSSIFDATPAGAVDEWVAHAATGETDPLMPSPGSSASNVLDAAADQPVQSVSTTVLPATAGEIPNTAAQSPEVPSAPVVAQAPASAIPAAPVLDVGDSNGPVAVNSPAPAIHDGGSNNQGGSVLDPVTDVVDGLVGGVGGVLDPVTDVVDGLVGGVGGVLDPVTDVVDGLVGGVGGVLDPVTDVVDGLVGGVGGVLDPVTDVVDGLVGGVGGVLDPVTDVVVGLVGGDGGLLDPVTDLVDDLTDGDALAPVTGLVDDLVGGDVLGPVTDLLGDGLGGIGGLLGPATGLPEVEGELSLIDAIPLPVDGVEDLVEGAGGLGSSIDPVTEVLDSLPVEGDLTQLAGGILPLVGNSSDDDGGGLLGGLLR
ncbi:hypothetical protein LPB072_19215 [Hydrogenophaga crassostreae]|uniref:Uncharacterized protein n=2 Tax=Hydrogenophaga crassostreae TaxID=1763535 RepID=A0A1D8NZX8_9BURK|nr:hypothetical protein LPB072_19215 [Hydrogenophaga crassostreae]